MWADVPPLVVVTPVVARLVAALSVDRIDGVVAVTGDVGECELDKLPGGRDAVVGFEAFEFALHDIDEEADDVLAAGGVRLDDICDFVVSAGFAGYA